MKVLHYGIIALHVHDLNNGESESNETKWQHTKTVE
jgi:CRISPR/Cas system-associated protein Cas7 (RAMP superfamily)